ncbi:calcium-activated chloride channel regulator 1-like [Corticium candelabrum]|uniref:calcium-activated chloride channel regulator 1-like n=1 Tax=Corticium candelabrum TaxID=121492 RepID=UPI002E26AFEF|nr:calcium-activated chloride channel regulator 1-like [Corticium candelabrum]
MHITPKRITDKWWTSASPPHKMFVHEWGHLRWGLFDEYYQSFYGPDFDGRPARCVEKVQATRTSSGHWRFSTNGVSASMMWKQYYNDVVEFCDDSDNATVKHYRDANNAHNRFCNMKSSWEVMRESDDFAKGVNLPREISSVEPTFRVVRKKSAAPAIVLVLDISNSMFLNGRIDSLRQAANTYINEIKEGSFVGIVFFNNKAIIRRNLVQITDQKSRNKLINSLPSHDNLGGLTSIGAAILKALGVLKHASTAKKQLVIATDGTETDGPYINDENVQQSIEKAGVVIHTIGIGESADEKLSSLSDKTGGKAFFHDEKSDESSGLQEAVATIIEVDSNDEDPLYQLSRQMVTINSKAIYSGSVDFDDGIGQDTVFNLFWSSKKFRVKRLKLSVKSANGKVYKYRKTRGPIYCNSNFMMCTLKVRGWTQPGKWTITVSNRDKIPISISWEVWSRKPTNAENAISLSTHLTRTDVSFPQLIVITASLMKGTRPVVDAVVTAIVTRPGAPPTHIHLQDNGAGADLMPFDGLYSATFTQFTVDGYYSVRVVANQNNQNKPNFTLNEDFNNMMAAKQARLGFRYVADDLPPDYSNIIRVPEPKSGENGDLLPAFQRIQVPGTFKVKNLPLSEVDVFPPSRIVDLVGQVTLNNEVQLSWTAPGGDLDNGQASAYSIRVSDNFDDLVDKFNQQHELIPVSLLSSPNFKINKPKMSGLKELVTFSSPVKAKMVFVAVKTRDNNQWSEISNVVHVSFKRLPNQVACTCPVKTKLKSAICTQDFGESCWHIQ